VFGGDPPVRKDGELNVDRMSKVEPHSDGCRSVRHGNRLARPANVDPSRSRQLAGSKHAWLNRAAEPSIWDRSPSAGGADLG
jgi:hypothetical protein